MRSLVWLVLWAMCMLVMTIAGCWAGSLISWVGWLGRLPCLVLAACKKRMLSVSHASAQMINDGSLYKD